MNSLDFDDFIDVCSQNADTDNTIYDKDIDNICNESKDVNNQIKRTFYDICMSKNSEKNKKYTTSTKNSENKKIKEMKDYYDEYIVQSEDKNSDSNSDSIIYYSDFLSQSKLLGFDYSKKTKKENEVRIKCIKNRVYQQRFWIEMKNLGYLVSYSVAFQNIKFYYQVIRGEKFLIKESLVNNIKIAERSKYVSDCKQKYFFERKDLFPDVLKYIPECKKIERDYFFKALYLARPEYYMKILEYIDQINKSLKFYYNPNINRNVEPENYIHLKRTDYQYSNPGKGIQRCLPWKTKENQICVYDLLNDNNYDIRYKENISNDLYYIYKINQKEAENDDSMKIDKYNNKNIVKIEYVDPEYNKVIKKHYKLIDQLKIYIFNKKYAKDY